jgi:hypothetical protein
LIRHSSAGGESPRRWVGLKQSGQKDKSMNQAETKQGLSCASLEGKGSSPHTYKSHTSMDVLTDTSQIQVRMYSRTYAKYTDKCPQEA